MTMPERGFERRHDKGFVAPVAADLGTYFHRMATNDTHSTLLANLREAKAFIIADALATSIRLSPEQRLRMHLKRQLAPHSDRLSNLINLADAVGITREQIADDLEPNPTVVTLVEGNAMDVEEGMRHGYLLLSGELPRTRPFDPITIPEWGVKVDFNLEAISGPNGVYRSTATVSAVNKH